MTKFFTGFDKNSKTLDFVCGLGQNIYYLPNVMEYDISKFGIEFFNMKKIKSSNDLNEVPNCKFLCSI